jgi:tetratricopeptide (TPR) repeat protein
MAGQEALLCPSCGARNKRTWEYCARCGESLQGAEAESASAKTVATPRTKAKGKGKLNILVHEKEPGSSLPPAVILGVGAVLLAALAFAGWRYARTAPAPQAADPSLFTMPSVPSARPPAPAAASEPGAADFNEGLRLLAAGKAADALPFLSRATSAAPSNARFTWVLGQALQQAGNEDEALARFSEAAGLDPKAHGIDYARALDKAGRSAEAAAAFEAALAVTPEHAGTEEELGKLYYKAGNFAKAAEFLAQAVEARSDDPVLRQELAYSVAQTGDKVRAEALYRSVLAIAPGAEISRGLLSEILFEQGKGPEAMALLQEGIQNNPEAPLLRRRLGNLAERAGNSQEAIRQYREYVRLAPNAPDAQDLAERAARLEGPGKS